MYSKHTLNFISKFINNVAHNLVTWAWTNEECGIWAVNPSSWLMACISRDISGCNPIMSMFD